MVKLLLIENNPDVRDRIHQALDQSGMRLSLSEVLSCSDAIALFDENTFDCLILESCSRIKSPVQAMKKLIGAKSWPKIPIIIIVPENELDQEAELTKLGAWDVLNNKTFTFSKFIRTVNQSIASNRFKISSLQSTKELKKHKKNASTSSERRALGELAADIGHDFNNVLTSVLGNLRMASLEKLPKPATDHIEKAMELILRGANLTDDLLVFSQKTNPTFRVVEPNDIVKGIHSRVRRFLGTTISLDHRLSIKRLRIFIDPLEFEDALISLVRNACDAILDFGTIKITVSECDVEGNRAGEEKFKPGRYVLFKIKDSGVGMSPAVLKKALKPKFTTKKDSDGAGFGLSNVAALVKQAKGYIKIESVEKQGTTVKLFLPHSKQVEEREAYAEPKEGALDLIGKGQTILLVEDDISVLNIVAQALKSKNYNVLKAEDAEEAFELILTAKDIDMLVTDVILPGNLTGKDVANRFHHRFPNRGIIYCSGYHEDLVRKKITLGPEGDVISKPYELSTLLIKMARVLQDK